jgi:fatty acid amide hydrolase 2
VLAPTAAFDLVGLPASEIPLGLGRDGMPTGVQAIAAPDRDHLTLAAAGALERAFGGWAEPPRWAGVAAGAA